MRGGGGGRKREGGREEVRIRGEKNGKCLRKTAVH